MLTTDGNTHTAQPPVPTPHPDALRYVRQHESALMGCIQQFVAYQCPDHWIEMLGEHLQDHLSSLRDDPPLPNASVCDVQYAYHQLFLLITRLPRCFDAYQHARTVLHSGLSPDQYHHLLNQQAPEPRQKEGSPA